MAPPFNNPNVDDTGFYVPFFSNPFGPIPDGAFANQFATVIAKPRPGQRPEALLPLLRSEVARADPNLPLYFPGTPKQHLDSALSAVRVVGIMFTVFGAVAMVLAAAGIYGVVAFSVSRRTQEFGVRMALGADHGRILGMVLEQGSRQVALGLVLGLGLAVAITTTASEGIGTMLFGVQPNDPLTYGSVLLLVSGVSLCAVLVPARRATRVHPATALRAE
jgi:ABC-type antimicrobial peptide transport system permease subunit